MNTQNNANSFSSQKVAQELAQVQKMSELVLEKRKEPLKTETPNCPICGNKTVRIDTHFHCGRAVLLSEVGEHYLGFNKLPDKLPEKGCPICGRTMVNIGKWRKLRLSSRDPIVEEGLDRMHCDQLDHYCYVTKTWYIKNRTSCST